LFIYAQLNENNICIGISQLIFKEEKPNLIELETVDQDKMYRKFENGRWSSEKFEPKEEPMTTIEEQIYAESLYQTALLEMQQMLGGM
jgi:hypothetical protein